MYSTSSASNFFKTNNRFSASTKKHTKLETIDELSSIEDIERELKLEKDRLLKCGARELSEEYLALLKERKLLESSPRTVGELPYSPTKNVSEIKSEYHRRSPTDMIRGFLEQAPKDKLRCRLGTLEIETQPVPICLSHWNSLCLYNWDKHNLCQPACPTGTGRACPSCLSQLLVPPPALLSEVWPCECNTDKAKQPKRDEVFLNTIHS